MVLTHDLLKHAFVYSYFDVDPTENVPEAVRSFIDRPTEADAKMYLNYLMGMKLRNVVGDNSLDTFIYIKPQFRYECNRQYELEILRHDSREYIAAGTPVYATNFFSTTPSAYSVSLFRYMKHERPNLDRVVQGDGYAVHEGTHGYVFAPHYTDWCGLRVCSTTSGLNAERVYRLYLVGDAMCQYFTRNNESAPSNGFLRNYCKGTRLYRRSDEYSVVTSKQFIADSVNTVLDSIEEELKGAMSVLLVQRDYIYDAEVFPADLLELLQRDFTSPQFVRKLVRKMDVVPPPTSNKHVVVDRYGVSRYRKMVVVMGDNALATFEDKYLFVPSDYLQIRGTMNAALVPKLGLVILAYHSFFGAKQVVQFDAKTHLKMFVRPLHLVLEEEEKERGEYAGRSATMYQLAPHYYLRETTLGARGVPAFVVVRVDNEKLLVRDNLSSSRHLKHLDNNWLKNTLLKLFVYHGHV